MTWNVLLPKEIHNSGPKSIRDIASFTSISEFGTSPDDLKPHIHDFDGVILRSAHITDEVLDAANNLKVIAKHGTGLDNVDIESATENGVIVCNTPGANARAVAEHTLMLIFATNRQLLAVNDETRSGSWERDNWISNELDGQTVGIFGCGNVGRTVATLAGGLGMEILGYDPYLDESDLPSVITKVDKETLFKQSNIVSVHSPLTPETHHAISTTELQHLSSRAIIINTSRGSIVDEDALCRAIENDDICGAGLDVFAEEPPFEDNPLFEHKNVIVTPHIAGQTEEALQRMAQRAAENVRTVYNGSIPDTTVNPDVMSD